MKQYKGCGTKEAAQAKPENLEMIDRLQVS